ncbi:MAG: lysylphosphatidylglycerol synthase domain-containing protein [Coleofasciculaceae cyanobacterium]
MSSPYRQRLSQAIPVIVGFVLFGFSIWTISQQFRHYHPRQVLENLKAIPDQSVLMGMTLTLLNYIMLTGYDTLAVRLVGNSLAYRQTALVAVISYAISNSIGFALLSGSAIRYRFYARWGLSAVKIAQIIAFCNLSFWIGLFAVGGVLFLVNPPTVPDLLNLPFDSVHSLGILFLACVLGYLGWSAVNTKKRLRIGRWELPHIPLKLALTQIIVTAADWALAAGVLYVLLPASIPVSYPSFFGIYMLAQLAGIISSVPGGLGVFETVILLILSPPVTSADLLGALLAYRGIYYFFPLMSAVLLLSLYESKQRFWR